MAIGDGDLAVFYDTDGFGSNCARRRPGEDDALFVGIKGAVDELVLDGYAVSAEHSLRYPSADVDLDEGDEVIVGPDVDVDGAVIFVAGAVQGGERYRVQREPWLINDGLETAALLSRVMV